MSPKILCPREAVLGMSDDNAAMNARGLERLLFGNTGEIVLIVAFAFAAIREATLGDDPGTNTARSAEIVLVVLAATLLLARRWPSLAAGAATLATTFAIARTQGATPAVVSFCVALFLLAALVVRRNLLFAVPLALPFLVYTARRLGTGHAALGSTAPLLFVVAALAVGESVRRRGLAVAALDATEEAMSESNRARTIMEERARIARELHDIVAHHLSVITVQSEAARLTSPGLSPDAGGRLEEIASTAREALTETRRLLGVLREDSGAEADRTPQPGLGELDDLIDQAQTAGTPIRLVRQGRIAHVSRSVDLAAYRIVQEALTNARRHAPGAEVDVEISYLDHMLRLRVRDYGPGPVDGEFVAGHGLMGMRERAMLGGGTFSSGPAAGGGFEVAVTLPIAENEL